MSGYILQIIAIISSLLIIIIDNVHLRQKILGHLFKRKKLSFLLNFKQHSEGLLQLLKFMFEEYHMLKSQMCEFLYQFFKWQMLFDSF